MEAEDLTENNAQKQNITVTVSRDTIRKAKILAARRATSISRLLAKQIDALVDAEETWERSKRSALALLEQGFHLGGHITTSRDELHER
jgi:hypothetical protein